MNVVVKQQGSSFMNLEACFQWLGLWAKDLGLGGWGLGLFRLESEVDLVLFFTIVGA